MNEKLQLPHLLEIFGPLKQKLIIIRDQRKTDLKNVPSGFP
jgi:hypothetical protein